MRCMTAALTALVLSLATGANAADLGGNCCADLEERVAELEATTANKGGRKMKLTVSGHVNHALIWVDTPAGSNSTISGNGNSQSRFRFIGESKIGPDWTAGYLMEIGTAEASTTGAAGYALGVRHSAFFLDNKNLGRVWLGKTSTATDGIAEIDLSNASVAATRLSLEPLSTSYFGGINLPFDGNREDILKYVSPTVAGFSISASWYANKNDAWDAALRYSGEFSGIRLAGGIGYRKEDDLASLGGKSATVNASGSVMDVGTGLFLNASYGDMKGATASTTLPLADVKAAHVQAGIERKWFDLGKTTFFAEWAELKSNGFKTDMMGFGAVQSIDAAAMDIYLAARRYDDLQVDTVAVGGIVRF